MTSTAAVLPVSDFEIPTHRDIINRAGGPAKVADALSLDAERGRERVKGWAREDSIPGPYWQGFVDSELATHEELARAAAEKLRTDATRE